jgi:hypothetical protein
MNNTTPATNRRPRIILGITGSIAAVKGPRLALRLSTELKADVKVVLTRTVEQYFWKEDKAVGTYDAECWNEFVRVVELSGGGGESLLLDDGGEGEDWRTSLTNGRISVHCEFII